uniref:Uncharacterized protein n=1 Tax=Manihot esculenta TaxID=3983 RepID=A0A2C9VLQ5_MANES
MSVLILQLKLSSWHYFDVNTWDYFILIHEMSFFSEIYFFLDGNLVFCSIQDHTFKF